MQSTQHKPFFMNTTTNQFSYHQPYAFIFDQTYKTKLDKFKFQHNPKFAYYNTVVKMKNKLSNNQHQVYEMIFDKKQYNSKNKNLQQVKDLKEKMSITNLSWKITKQNQTSAQLIQQPQQKANMPENKRKSVRQISFQQNNHRRRQSEIYYDRKPRLDDILAEYKRMNIKQRQNRNKSFLIRQKNKKNQQLEIFKTGKFFTSHLSLTNKANKTYNS